MATRVKRKDFDPASVLAGDLAFVQEETGEITVYLSVSPGKLRQLVFVDEVTASDIEVRRLMDEATEAVRQAAYAQEQASKSAQSAAAYAQTVTIAKAAAIQALDDAMAIIKEAEQEAFEKITTAYTNAAEALQRQAPAWFDKVEAMPTTLEKVKVNAVQEIEKAADSRQNEYAVWSSKWAIQVEEELSKLRDTAQSAGNDLRQVMEAINQEMDARKERLLSSVEVGIRENIADMGKTLDRHKTTMRSDQEAVAIDTKAICEKASAQLSTFCAKIIEDTNAQLEAKGAELQRTAMEHLTAINDIWQNVGNVLHTGQEKMKGDEANGNSEI